METNQQQSASMLPQKTPNFWEANKLLLKGALIGLLILIMLIPSAFIHNLVTERATRQQEVIHEVSSKWSLPQTLTGPYLLIPYQQVTTQTDGKELITKKLAYFLPEALTINGTILPEVRKRSLYKVNLYRSDLQLSGSFLPPDFNALQIDPGQVLWDQAKLVIGLDDARGIEENILLEWNNISQAMEAGVPENVISKSGLHLPVKLTPDSSYTFQIPLKIKGSEYLYVAPLGKTTTMQLRSVWKDPAFDGNYLPQQSKVSEAGFTADWTVLQASRSYPQQFTDMTPDIARTAFGVKLLQPTDTYTKTERSVKYALLFIALTFAVFFFMEIVQKKQVHPLQYILVGISLLLFYTLLLSFGEYIGYNWSYLVAAAATIVLITLYVRNIFRKGSIAWGFGASLVALYGYIFFLIQLQDYALVFGSVGLFVIVAICMYASRKVDWYGQDKK